MNAKDKIDPVIWDRMIEEAGSTEKSIRWNPNRSWWEVRIVTSESVSIGKHRDVNESITQALQQYEVNRGLDKGRISELSDDDS